MHGTTTSACRTSNEGKQLSALWKLSLVADMIFENWELKSMHLYEISNQNRYPIICTTSVSRRSCFDNERVARCVVVNARALGPDTVYLLVTPKSCLLRAVSGSRSGSGCKARLLGYSIVICAWYYRVVSHHHHHHHIAVACATGCRRRWWLRYISHFH